MMCLNFDEFAHNFLFLQKRQKDDQRPLEEKIKTLKKRNAELAAIARRLEEKAKHLQQENMKVVAILNVKVTTMESSCIVENEPSVETNCHCDTPGSGRVYRHSIVRMCECHMNFKD